MADITNNAAAYNKIVLHTPAVKIIVETKIEYRSDTSHEVRLAGRVVYDGA